MVVIKLKETWDRSFILLILV